MAFVSNEEPFAVAASCEIQSRKSHWGPRQAVMEHLLSEHRVLAISGSMLLQWMRTEQPTDSTQCWCMKPSPCFAFQSTNRVDFAGRGQR